MSSRVQHERGESADGFAGLRVVAFESRMAAEVAAMIERNHGVAIVAPSMREAPLEDNPQALDFAERLLGGRIEVVIFLTGVGTRALFRVIETRHPRAAIVAALSSVVTVARGPKPVAALREYAITPSIVIPEPNTWREVLTELALRIGISGKRVAVQEYGVPNADLIAGLEARGAEVMSVPVYRWTLPLDRAPLRAALKAIAGGEADVALFTSSNQVTNVMQMAEADGLGAAVRHGFAAMVVGSVGPVCSEQLRANAIAVDFEPEHPKLGHLVKEAAAKSASILKRKREALPHIEVRAPARAPARAGDAPAHSAAIRDLPMMKACRREPVPYTPIWLMRQAGRYMPEYRRVRERYSFLDMCQRPEVAAEVTVTAMERLGVDAAIIFADILLPLVPMGVGLHYEAGDGPQIDRPLSSGRGPGADSAG